MLVLFLTSLNGVECSCGQTHIHLAWEGWLLISVILSLDNLDQMVASQHFPFFGSTLCGWFSRAFNGIKHLCLCGWSGVVNPVVHLSLDGGYITRQNKVSCLICDDFSSTNPSNFFQFE